MSTVRYRKGAGGDGPRISFAFFLAGALVVLVAVFVIGIQVGRVIEKEKLASTPPGGSGTQVVKLTPSPGPGPEATSSPVEAMSPKGDPKSPPPLTFPETLEKSEAVVVSLPKEKEARESRQGTDLTRTYLNGEEVPAKGSEKERGKGRPRGGKESSGASEETAAKGQEVFLQAGVFTDKYGAETMRKKIRRAGYESSLRPATGKNGKPLHKVLAGPFPDRATARGAERKLKASGIDVYLPRG